VQVSGNKDLAFEGLDIDGDFDPAEYDKQMASVFAKYDQVDVDKEGERPVFSDDDSDLEIELETENWDEWQPGTKVEGGAEEEEEEEKHVEDPDFVMDCDYEGNLKEKTQMEILESTRRGS
jgi:protein KRI1